MMVLSNKEIIQELKNLTFVAPIAQIYFITDNPEYDIESYSKELDMLHENWNYPNYDGPIHYQGYDELGNYQEEDTEHKIWRLNHNKKYDKMKMVMAVKPKKSDNNLYLIDNLNEIFNKLKQYSIYSIYK